MLRHAAQSLIDHAARHGLRRLSSVRVVRSCADRELAQPLAFLSVQGWPQSQLADWEDWATRFSKEGYSSLLLNLDPAAALNNSDSSSALLAELEREMVRLLRDPANSSPFPPLLFASQASSLVAETYVSSHPLSGLCLVEPTPAPVAHEQLPSVFSSLVDDFNYEPGFPIAVVGAERSTDRQEHRLLKEFEEEDGEGLVQRVVWGSNATHGWSRLRDWMDENGF
ncbi:hypothetical protein JCM10207_001135 [Rhodosporidiobolus poonsookiae]